MNKHIADVFLKYKSDFDKIAKIVKQLQAVRPELPDLRFSRRYWKNAYRIEELEDIKLTEPFDASFASGGVFVCPNTADFILDIINSQQPDHINLDKNALCRIWQFIKYVEKDGFHELHVDRNRAKMLSQTKCNYFADDFKSPYASMFVVYPPELEEDFIDSYTKTTPLFSFCHHDIEEGFLEVNHFYVEKSDLKQVKKVVFDNYFAFGCKLDNFAMNIETVMAKLASMRDPDGHNGHAYYYTRIAINALMISTTKDWTAPVGKSYEDLGRKHRMSVRAALPKSGLGLSFTYDKVTMKLPTLTMNSSGGGTGTGDRQRWHTRECHWRRVRVGQDKHHEWRWIDSYEVNKDLKPLDAIISTSHKLNHEIGGLG